jgi:K+-transporting ATPase KdpF subunit
MNWLYMLSTIIAVLLFAYLVISLIRAEDL